MRDRCMNGIFKRRECNDIIEFLYTDFSVFIMVLNVPSYFE